jgi:hypothetical protein
VSARRLVEHAAATHPWLVGLEQSGLGAAMRQSVFLYPGVETIHIIGFALLVGSIVAFDLRVLGFGRAVPLEPLARIAVPLAGAGLCIAVPAGFCLFATEATHVAVNPSFQVKLCLIALGLANLALFHLGPWRRLGEWGAAGGRAPLTARIGAAVSILAWGGAVTAGRLIAYF